jgi:hypothetical protein
MSTTSNKESKEAKISELKKLLHEGVCEYMCFWSDKWIDKALTKGPLISETLRQDIKKELLIGFKAAMLELLTDEDKKYLLAVEMRKDNRSMAYIAKKMGYAHPSSVEYLLNKYTRRQALETLVKGEEQ